MLYPIEKVGLLIAAVIAMAGMGAALTTSDIKANLKKPYGVIIGFICQFGLMPFLAYYLTVWFNLSTAMAIGLILIGSCPGGILSNILTYFAKGNLGLSVTMTAASCFMAIVMMPISAWLYLSPYTSNTFQIPYNNIFIGLAIMLVPLTIGMRVRLRNEAKAKTLEKIGSVFGNLVLFYLIVSWFPKYSHLLVASNSNEIISCACLSFLGFAIAYLIATICRLSVVDRSTVSLETGIQNGNIALIIILIAFKDSALQDKILWALLLYGIFGLVFSAAFAWIFRKMNCKKIESSQLNYER
ncbi:bile acid:sodium symporter [Candidatus Uabimicrobium sp. HlEnr_7]|uniref:bile acid:sodium symporter n=1 Tax=Candidatus Uabimicrobium helgolandensis TaxID=3095367 RepID=UPI003558C21D